MEFYRKDVFESNSLLASHEYFFAITARTYIMFPVACDTKTIDQGIKIRTLSHSTEPFTVSKIASVPLKVYRPLALITKVKGSQIIYLLGGTTKRNC